MSEIIDNSKIQVEARMEEGTLVIHFAGRRIEIARIPSDILMSNQLSEAISAEWHNHPLSYILNEEEVRKINSSLIIRKDAT